MQLVMVGPRFFSNVDQLSNNQMLVVVMLVYINVVVSMLCVEITLKSFDL